VRGAGATREPGLILRPVKLGDSSKIVSALTERFGRVKLVAKGSRQLGSRLSALLEPGNELDLVFYPHDDRELWMLGDAALVRAALTGGNTLNKLSHLLATMELADRLLPEREPVPEFHLLLRAFLDQWHSTEDEGQAALFFWVELGFLERTGIGLDPAACADCGKSLAGADRAGVRAAEGDILCSDCAPPRTRWIDGGALHELQSLAASPFVGDEPRSWPRLDPEARQQIGRLLHEHMTLHLPGYRLPASLYWLAPSRADRGSDR
jgi:DNA repair protein RecO (recombination protein O)